MDNLNTLNSQVDNLIRKTVAEVQNLQKQYFLDRLGLNGGATPVTNGASNGAAHAAPAVKSTKVSAKKPVTKKVAKSAKAKPAKPAKSTKAAKSDAAKGVKRDPAVLQALMDTIHKHVLENQTAEQGLRIEEIGKALGKTSVEMTLPIKKLIALKKIKSKGQKRATRYSAK